MGSPNEIVAGCEKLRVCIGIITQDLPPPRKSALSPCLTVRVRRSKPWTSASACRLECCTTTIGGGASASSSSGAAPGYGIGLN
jgi:hypothetical protein